MYDDFNDDLMTVETNSRFKCSQGNNGVQQLTMDDYVVSFTNAKDERVQVQGFQSAKGLLKTSNIKQEKDVIVVDSDESSDEVVVVKSPEPAIRLDETQARIAKLSFDHPLLVVAGAGSGKTATLCARVIEIIKSGVEAPRVLVITFTNKAADELKQRIFRYMQASGLIKVDDDKKSAVTSKSAMRQMPYASTFHSWCYGILMRFHTRLGFNRCPLVAATEAEHKKLMYLAKDQLEDCRRLVQCEYMLNIPPPPLPQDAQSGLEPSIYIHDTESRWNEVLLMAKKTTGFSIDWQKITEEEEKESVKKSKFTERAKAKIQHMSLTHALYQHLHSAIGQGRGLVDLDENQLDLGLAFPGKDTIQEMMFFMYRSKSKGYNPAQFPQIERSVLEAYNGTLRRFGLVDFDDLLDMANQLLDNAEVLQEIRNEFPYLLVDEFQDFNRLQTQLVLKLQVGVGRVTAVGDLKQSIFEFRGATCEENYHIFLEQFIDAQVEGRALGAMETLTTNYRSHKSIVDLSNIVALDTVDEKDTQLRRLLTPSTALDTAPVVPVTVWNTRDIRDEAATISSRIKAILDKGDCLASDIAVISRCLNFGSYKPTGAIETELLRKGIPFVVRGGHSALKSKRMQLFMALVRIIANPDDDIAAEYCLDELVQNIGPVNSKKIRGLGKDKVRQLSLFEQMTHASTNTSLLTKSARTGLQAFLGDVEKWQQLMGDKTLEWIIKDIFAQYILKVEEGDEDKDKNVETSAKKGDIEDPLLDMVLAILDSLYQTPELLSATASAEAGNDSPCTMELLQAYSSHLCLLSTAAEDKGKLKTAKDQKPAKYEGAVVITTVHQAKGLEWQHVFLNHFIENMFPMGYRGVSKADKLRAMTDPVVGIQIARASALHYREESRLGYVAITRAKVGLYISVLDTYPVFWMGKIFDGPCRASRFLPDIMCTTTSSKKRRIGY
ncbi:hypothetical protein IW137_001749 [Coemansia sp. RSA 1287]|nr:hypothetical protein IW137_001749 [Coemansia sp. RSA 1287]